jgi:MFS family permease
MQQRPETDRAQATAAPALWHRLAGPMSRAVVALGITQIIGWGTTIYALGVLAKPIATDTGWRLDLVISGVMLAILAAGLVSTAMGRLIDRSGARHVMTLGSVAAGLLLAIIALAPSLPVYLAAWALLGVAMRTILYDAAFPALVQIAPTRGRAAISYLTLFGGFASSIFWPLGYVLVEPFGWRGTFLIYALLNLFVCAPLHWWGLRDRDAVVVNQPNGEAAKATAPDAPTRLLEGLPRRIAMVLFAIVISACAFVFGALAVLLPAVLEASGITANEAIFLASIKGVAQFAGRVCDIRWGQNLGVLTVGRIAVVCLPLAFAALLFGSGGFAWAFVFTMLFGIANGLVTIVRGAVPLALFGSVGYGAVMGLLATPYLITNAAAPVVLALVIEGAGMMSGLWVLAAASTFGWVAMEVMAAWYRRLRATTSDQVGR